MKEVKEKLITSEQIETTIKQCRNAALTAMLNGPTVLPHTLLYFSCMMHGHAQAAAVILSENGPSGEKSEGVAIDGSNVVPNEIINDDAIAFAALMMIRCHTIAPNGLITQMTPNIISETFLDFKKLKGRDPAGIAKSIHDVAEMSKTLPQPTFNTLGDTRH